MLKLFSVSAINLGLIVGLFDFIMYINNKKPTFTIYYIPAIISLLILEIYYMLDGFDIYWTIFGLLILKELIHEYIDNNKHTLSPKIIK